VINNCKLTKLKEKLKKHCTNLNIFVVLQRVSLIRPAPVELPQVRKEARVDGCSGAM